MGPGSSLGGSMRDIDVVSKKPLRNLVKTGALFDPFYDFINLDFSRANHDPK